MKTSLDETIEKLERLLENLKAERKEEERTLRRGDIVICEGTISSFKSIFLGENAKETWVLVHDVKCPQSVSKHTYTIRKIGEHVDLDGILERYCAEESED